jgi:hypothetical protein
MSNVRRIRGGWQRAIRVAMASVVVLLSLGAAQAASPAAQASTVINFDNLTAGVKLTSQYAAEGVTFGVAAPGQGISATMLVASEPSAFSPPNDVLVQCGEACQTNMWAEFSAPQQQVSMYLNNEGVNGTVSSTVNAYDGSGNLVASTPFTAPSGQWQQVSVNDPTQSIIYVEVVNWQPGAVPAFRMDNFSFSGNNQPDFALVPGFDPAYGVGVPAGVPSSISFTLRRFGGSTGSISFSPSVLSTGETVTLSPNPDDNGDNTPVQVTITGPLPGTSFPVTITATPDTPSAGTQAHSVTFPVTVQGTYRLRVQGIEITQGVQDTTLPARDPSDLSAPVSYSGVQLADRKTTAVRVFADAPGAPLDGGGILGVTAQLTGYAASGAQLGTLGTDVADTPNEDGTGGLVDTGSATVPDSERDSATGSFEFLLPTSWEGTAATLKVTLIPPNQLFGPPPFWIPCTTAACQALASMTLDNITYTGTGFLGLAEITLTDNGANPSVEETPGYWAGLIPAGYVMATADYGSLDIGSILAGCPGPFGKSCSTRDEKNHQVLSALEDWANNGPQPQPEGILGITDQDLGNETGDLPAAEAVVNGNRPVTDVDHEIGHMLGLVHASYDCGGGANGQHAESWPPDQHGYIDSIGLDITGIPPFTVVAGPGGPQDTRCTGQNPLQCGGSQPQQYFDFMSYCANSSTNPNSDGTLGSSDAWVSARNWDQMAGFLSSLGEGTGGTARLRGALVHQPATPNVMRVLGFTDPADGTHITLVDPTPSAAPLLGTRSGFTVVAVNGAGTVTASAPLYAQQSHTDGVGGSAELQGALPLGAGTTAAKLEVTHAGQVVATLPRPAVKPVLTLTGSVPAGTCAGSKTNVNWDVTDSTRLHLTAAVDFSADGGTTWREVYDGPAVIAGPAGGATIPRTLLTTTKQAELRVRVSDGYNQVSANSAQFCVAPAAPTVTISTAADQLTPGGMLALSGSAFDDNRTPITGKLLTWRAYGPGLPPSGSLLGTGSPLITTLPAATAQITLTATAADGSATATEQASTPLTPLRPENGWTGGPFGTAQPAAALIAGIVHLRGAIATAATNTNPVAFTLPPALRPATSVYVAVGLCNAANGRLLIQPDGTVTVQAANSFSSAQCFTSLDGASYVLQPTVTLVPLNGWTGAPYGTSQPAATLASGVVHLKGALAANGTSNPWVFTLPPALRPATNVYVPVDLCDAANGRLLIQPDGVVTVQAENSFSGAQCFTSLDGASFALTASTSLTTLNGWSGAPFGTSDPAASLVSGVVQFKGAIRTSGTDPVAFTLPAGLRPATDTYVQADLCDAANGRLLIQPDGVVTVQAENSFSGAQCFTSLDGISFVR